MKDEPKLLLRYTVGFSDKTQVAGSKFVQWMDLDKVCADLYKQFINDGLIVEMSVKFIPAPNLTSSKSMKEIGFLAD